MNTPRGDAVEDALVALHRLAAMFEARGSRAMENNMIPVNEKARKSMVYADIAKSHLVKAEAALAEANAAVEKITKQTLKQVCDHETRLTRLIRLTRLTRPGQCAAWMPADFADAIF
jgi:lantibiotic modifying enzyme